MTPEQMITSRKEFAVIWMRFMQRFQRGPKSEIWVFEGKEDLDYYPIRIESIYGIGPGKSVVIAEGKENSIRLRSTIEKDAFYASSKVAFFVDADFDDPTKLQGSTTYITPCYSIENFYLSRTVIDQFLTEKLQMFDNEDRQELDKILERFLSWRDTATALLLPFCALMALAKRNPEPARSLTTFLRDKLYTEVISLKQTKMSVEVTTLISPAALNLLKMPTVIVPSDDITAQVNEWIERTGINSYSMVRGKFFLHWLAKALSLLIEDSNKKMNRSFFSKRRLCSQQIREGEILATLSKYADTPHCLRDFLKTLSASWKPINQYDEVPLAFENV